MATPEILWRPGLRDIKAMELYEKYRTIWYYWKILVRVLSGTVSGSTKTTLPIWDTKSKILSKEKEDKASKRRAFEDMTNKRKPAGKAPRSKK
jgi:hypothetical protein